MTEPVPGRTVGLARCVRAAEALALHEDDPVSVDHLGLVVAFHVDPEARSRLVMVQLGAHHFFEDDAVDQIAPAFVQPARSARWTPEAEAALGTLAHWAERTGDRTADTAHLLLAVLDAGSEVFDGAGVTTRDGVRAAISVRQRVGPNDRQPGDRGPILSRWRPDRPVAYRFEPIRRNGGGPRRVRHIALRSQVVVAEYFGARVQYHLAQLHMLTILGLAVMLAMAVMVTGYAAVAVTPWSALWMASLLLRRSYSAIPVRLVVDVAMVVASDVLAVPGWVWVAPLVVRGFDLVEGRLGLLVVRGDVAEPGLTEHGLRADRRVNAKGAAFFGALRLTGKLSTR